MRGRIWLHGIIFGIVVTATAVWLGLLPALGAGIGGQTDEADLGFAYADVDRLLYLMVDRRAPEADLLAAKFDRRTIRRVREMIRRTQFKRRPPLIAKVSLRTIGVDFRYPRDWGT